MIVKYILILGVVQSFYSSISCNNRIIRFPTKESVSRYLAERQEISFFPDGCSTNGAELFEVKELNLKIHTKKITQEVFDKVTIEEKK